MRYTGTTAANYPKSMEVFTKEGAAKSKLGIGMGISMGNTVQHVTEICNMVIAQGYGGIIQWDVTRNGGAPANMTAIAPFVDPNYTGTFTSGPTQYHDAITLSIDAGNGMGFPHIRYSVGESSGSTPVKLGLYDMHGALIQTLFQGPSRAGENTIALPKADAGAYVVRLTAGQASLSAKAVLTR
jgi:hypothetical protein